MNRIDNLLFKTVNNSALVVFRILFGLLITLESWGAIATGWVTRVLVEPRFTFNFLGFDILQNLQGPFMYVWFLLMGCFGLGVMLGYRYRLSIFLFSLFWAAAYFMQKSAYNNHYYLLVLLNLIMCVLPAHRDYSLDVKQGRVQKCVVMPNWVYVLIIGQLAIVYTYASLAKLYPDWLNAEVIALFMVSKLDYPLVGEWLQERFIHYAMSYFGIAFDLLVVPLLLWSKTRKLAFVLSIFFHLFNSVVFQIGIFPYMSLAFTVFFFPAEVIRRLFLPKRLPVINPASIKSYSAKLWVKAFIGLWLLIQVLLPLRPYIMSTNVFWTEEGHRLSWRMMLRAKSSLVSFRVKSKKDQKLKYINLGEYLTKKQIKSLGKPDVFWQFVQYLKQDYPENHYEIYATAWVKLNNHRRRQLVSPDLDLTTIKWHYVKTNPWLLLEEF